MFYSVLGIDSATPGLEGYPKFDSPASFNSGQIFAVTDAVRKTTYLFAPMQTLVSGAVKAFQIAPGFENGHVVYFQHSVAEDVHQGLAMQDPDGHFVKQMLLSKEVSDLLGTNVSILFEPGETQKVLFGAIARSDKEPVYIWVATYSYNPKDGVLAEVTQNSYGTLSAAGLELSTDNKVRIFLPVVREAVNCVFPPRLVLLR